MANVIKNDFMAGLTLGECFGYSDPGTHLIAKRAHCSFLPYVGQARCLMDLLNKNLRVTTRLLLSQYAVWVAEIAKKEEARLENLDPGFLNGLTIFMTQKAIVGLNPVSELSINASGLPRLAPLAFYWQRYQTVLVKNPPYIYRLIYELSAISVGHRRAAVACGLFLNGLAGIIGARVKYEKTLTNQTARNVMRLRIIQTLLYYNSTYEYRGETGHFALLQQNKNGRLHLETVAEAELKVSDYAVDTLLYILWLFFKVGSINVALQKAARHQLPALSASVGALFATAYGKDRLNPVAKEKYKDILQS